jgi:methylglutaconyl-CoA hydratase
LTARTTGDSDENGGLGVARDGPILRLTLARPRRRNALSRELVASLLDVFAATRAEGDVRAIVLSGSGPVFCAGADLREFVDASDDRFSADAGRLSDLLVAMATCPIPIIASVQGAAYGGGLGLVCAADIAIASVETRFSLSEARLGLIPAMIAPYVIAALGAREAKARMLLAEAYGVEIALRQGLIHQTVPRDELAAATNARAAELLKGAPGALTTIKRLPELLNRDDAEATRTALKQLLADRRGSPEGREGMSAFLEKRAPAWAEPDRTLS